MKPLVTVLFIIFCWTSVAQEKFPSNADLDDHGTMISKDGKHLYIYDYKNETLMKWDLMRGKSEWMSWEQFQNTEDYYDYHEFPGVEDNRNAAFGTVTRNFLVVLDNGKIGYFDGKTGELIRTISKPYDSKDGSQGAAYSHEGTYVAYRDGKKLIKVVNVATGEEVHEVPYFADDGKVYFSVFGPWFFWRSSGEQRKMELYHLEEKKIYDSKRLDEIANFMSYAYYLPNSKKILVSWNSRLFDPVTDELEQISVPVKVSYITPDDRIVNYEYFSKYSEYKWFKGIVSYYDPIREFMISQEVLAEGKSLEDYIKAKTLKENKSEEKEVDKAYTVQLEKEKREMAINQAVDGEGKMYCFNYIPIGSSLAMTINIKGCETPPSNESKHSGSFNRKCFGTKEEAYNAFIALKEQYKYNIKVILWSEFTE